MEHFKTILVVNDAERKKPTALERAVTLAKVNRSVLTVVEVLEKFLPQAKGAAKKTEIDALQKIVIEETSKRLADLVAPVKAQGITAVWKILYGTPFIEIIREVFRNNHDLVMLSPRKKPRWREMLFGNRIMHLMRKCPCPVWAIKPSKEKTYARILVAVDPVPSDDERNALNIKIMEIAASLAASEASELHIIHCWNFPYEERSRVRAGLRPSQLKEIVRSTRKIQKRNLDRLLATFNLKEIPHKVHLLKGEPDRLIVEMTRKKRIELVVMGTVCRTGIAGFFIGNTAEKVLQQVDCSVLAVKPDGFTSPVELE